MLTSLWTTLLDVVYPPKCPVCHSRLEEHGAWCEACSGRVLAPREINLAVRKLAALDSCRVICDYSAGIKRLLHDIKFRRAERYALPLRWLLIRGLADAAPVEADWVVPVPLHASRLAERGYNQTEKIFQPWAKSHGFSWCGDALARTRATLPQWELDLEARRRNVKGAFQATRPEVIHNQAILLVDDIITSGITLNECAKVLKRAGARTVSGLALAGGGA